MDLETAKKYIGIKARWLSVEGKIQDVKEIIADEKTGRKMTLAFIEGGSVFNIEILRAQNEDGEWVSLDQTPL